MYIKYNIEKLGSILNDLSVLTGISIAFLDCELNRLCGSVKENDFCEKMQKNEEFLKKCICSDNDIIEKCNKTKCFENHICYAGLYDASLPVVVNGVTVGFIIMGRVRTDLSPKECFFTDSEELRKLYCELPYFSDSQLQSLKTLLPSILFADAINFELDEISEKMAEYIESNLTEDLSISNLCKKFFVSKNFLYKCFKEHYSTTVNEYIMSVRLKEAKKLLLKTKDPIFLICEKAGIPNYTYFCKFFKRRVGMSPVEFRRNHSK